MPATTICRKDPFLPTSSFWVRIHESTAAQLTRALNILLTETLRALYLPDNDFEYLPPEIGQLKNLRVVSTCLPDLLTRDSHHASFQLVLRDNDLIVLPKELGLLTLLRELHIQNNRLTILPPELGSLDLTSQWSVVRMEGNYWVPPIADQLQLGVSHVMDYIRSDTYKL